MIKIVVDSTSDITKQEAEKLGIVVVPMKVLIDGKEYVAGEDLQTNEFYEKLKKCKDLPQTTQINQDEYLKTIKPLLEEGHSVFAMALSSGLSGSFNSLRLASEELKSENLEIFDTQSVTLAYKILVLETVKLAKKCKDLQELKMKAEKLKEKCGLLAVVDNVKYLIKGGRLSLAAGIAVTALNIKPIVTIKNGKLAVVSKGIGYNNALKNLIKHLKNIDFSKEISIGHTNDLKRVESFVEMFKFHYDIKVSRIDEIGSIIGTHAGPGCVGIAYFEK